MIPNKEIDKTCFVIVAETEDYGLSSFLSPPGLYGNTRALLPLDDVQGTPALSRWLNSQFPDDKSLIENNVHLIVSPQTLKLYEVWAMSHSLSLENNIHCFIDDDGIEEQGFLAFWKSVLLHLFPASSLSSSLSSSSYTSRWDRFVFLSSSFWLDDEPQSWQEWQQLLLLPSSSFNSRKLTSLKHNAFVALSVPSAVLADPKLSVREIWETAESIVSHSAVVNEWMDPAAFVTAKGYLEKWSKWWNNKSTAIISVAEESPIISCNVHARIGLIGNPSDGFYGKTISCLIDNFWAQVVLSPNQHALDGRIEIVKDASLSMASLKTLRDSAARDGYYGSDRIFQAVLKLFYELCCLKQIPVPKRGFKIYCKTTIPRQVGLAGSSALATALLKCLVQYCNIPESQFPKHEQANLALSAERDELGISAGHQDRVVQIYGGLVYMDFDRALMKGRGYGDYQKVVGSDLLLSRFGLWLAYERQGKESGKVHRNIKALFDAGDERIVTGMADLAALADQAKRILQNDNLNDTLNEKRLKLARLMDRNFELRRQIYGDEGIGLQTRRMVSIAKEWGHAAKQSGSGGCIIGLSNDPTDPYFNELKLKESFQREGFIFTRILTSEQY